MSKRKAENTLEPPAPEKRVFFIIYKNVEKNYCLDKNPNEMLLWMRSFK